MLAKQNGEICTIPLIKIMEGRGEGFIRVMSHIIDAFIVVSVMVSFGAVGLGYKHTLDGLAKCAPGAGTPMHARWRHIIGVGGFALVLVVGILFRKYLYVVLEVFVSVSSNFEAGLVYAIMYPVPCSLLCLLEFQ